MTLSPKDEARLKFLREAKPNSWFAVSEDGFELFGQGDTPEEALEQAREKGHSDPVLTMAPPECRASRRNVDPRRSHRNRRLTRPRSGCGRAPSTTQSCRARSRFPSGDGRAS